MRLAWVLLCLISLGAWASTTTPEQFGAYGNGIRGTSGVANGTTTFTDPNASWTASDVNKTIFIVPPIQTSYPTYQGTIAAVGSSTSITIHPALGWSSGLPGCSAAISGITRAAPMVVTISASRQDESFRRPAIRDTWRSGGGCDASQRQNVCDHGDGRCRGCVDNYFWWSRFHALLAVCRWRHVVEPLRVLLLRKCG